MAIHPFKPYFHACMHTNVPMYVCTCSQAKLCVHASTTQLYVYVCMQLCTWLCAHSCAPAHAYAHRRTTTCTCVCVHAYGHNHVCMLTRALSAFKYMRICPLMCACMCVHAYEHTLETHLCVYAYLHPYTSLQVSTCLYVH